MNNSFSKKNRIICAVAYILLALIFSFQRQHPFSLIYFAAIGLVAILSDKIFREDFFSLKPLAVTFFAAINHNTMYEIFCTTHGNLEQLMAAFGIAVFFAGFFAATDKAKLPYCIFAAPVLCFLNLRIAICYSVLLLSISIFYLQSIRHGSTTKKQKKKNDINFSEKNVVIISIAVYLISLAVCIFLALKPENMIQENYIYYLTNFKNNLAVAVLSVYLLIKLIKKDIKMKTSILVGFFIHVAGTVFATIFLACSALSLSILCIAAFLSFCCLQNNNIIEEIKADYYNNKFMFWVLIICLLQ